MCIWVCVYGRGGVDFCNYLDVDLSKTTNKRLIHAATDVCVCKRLCMYVCV